MTLTEAQMRLYQQRCGGTIARLQAFDVGRLDNLTGGYTIRRHSLQNCRTRLSLATRETGGLVAVRTRTGEDLGQLTPSLSNGSKFQNLGWKQPRRMTFFVIIRRICYSSGKRTPDQRCRITAREIRLVGSEGEQLGIDYPARRAGRAETEQIWSKSHPTAQPPVVQADGLRQFKYQESKEKTEMN